MAAVTVAILFTDLVGSTELAVRVGPGVAETIRKEHFSLVRDASQVADGQEVKNLGDGLMVVFPSASAAVNAAAAAQQAIELRSRSADVRFEVRMGIAVGEAALDGGDYFGEPVIQAARLCALARGGQILVTDHVRSFATTAAHPFADVGALELKGFPEPVPAHEVSWSPSTGSVWPLPPRLRAAPEVAYVGREAERTELEAAWKRATAGEGSLVLVAGEPGIGKTRLASLVAYRAHETGGTVLYGAVDEGLGVPYHPWIEALGHYVENVRGSLLRRYVAEAGPDLVRLTPSLRQRVPDLPDLASSDGETERYLLLDAVSRLLRVAAEDNPVLVVIDDLHWADKPTLMLLQHLHRQLADVGVLFVVTYRDSDLTPGLPLTDVLAGLHREQRVSWLALEGLGHDDLVQLLHNTSGQAPTEVALELARVLERDTAGNPLFVGEVLRDLFEGDHLWIDEDGQWALATDLEQLPVPVSVREVVLQRVRRLGPDAEEVLPVAAVIGRNFDIDLLADVLDRPVDELVEVLDAATRASLLTESSLGPGVLRFIHMLIGQALVDTLPRVRLALLHRRVATVIEERHGPELGSRVGVVAGHLLAAGGEPSKAIDYSRRAGRHALLALASDEALRWFRIALDLLDEGDPVNPSLRCDLLIDIGEAMRDSGEPGARDQLIEAAHLARRLGDGDAAARAVLAMDRSFAASFGTTDEELVQAIETAIHLRHQRDGTRARLLAMLGSETMFYERLERREQLVEEAVEIARDVDEVTLAAVLASSLGAVWTASRLERRSALLAELRRVVPVVADPQLRACIALHGVTSAVEVGDRGELDRSLAALRTANRGTAPPLARWLLLAVESLVATVDGDLRRAEEHSDAALTLATEAGIQDGFLVYSTHLTNRYFLQGRLGELAGLIEESRRANPATGVLRSILALALCEGGDLDGALALLDEELADGIDTIPLSATWSGQLTLLARIANRGGRVDAARVVYPVAMTVPDVLACSGATCSTHMAIELGMLAATLGRRGEAIEHFERADRRLEAFRAPILLARCRYEHARALLDLGIDEDGPRARELLGQAAAGFATHDCPIRAAECEELLAAPR